LILLVLDIFSNIVSLYDDITNSQSKDNGSSQNGQISKESLQQLTSLLCLPMVEKKLLTALVELMFLLG
jgi:hypothetical protein